MRALWSFWHSSSSIHLNRPMGNGPAAYSLIELLFVEFLFHHDGLIIAQAGDGNLLHILIELNREHALF